MSDHAGPKAHLTVQINLPSVSERSRANRPPRSNFIDELIKAREAEYRSVGNMAEMAHVAPGAIRKLESGKGPVATLVAVMKALPFQPTVLAPAANFGDQLRDRRIKIAKPVEVIAAKSGLSVEEIVELETGGGSVENLLRLLSVIAPKVKRRAPERVYWSADKKAERDSRFTPPDFMSSIYQAFGQVDLDPCAHPASPVIAERRFILEQGDDGLKKPWCGKVVYVNPPYSGFVDWIKKAHNEWAAGNVETVVCLVPVRIDSTLFQDFVKPNADIYFLRGRLRFGKEGGKPQPTPHSLMVVIFGATARQKKEFGSLVRGFWAPANDRQVDPARNISTTERLGAPIATYPFHATSCAPAVWRNSRSPVRVYCGPSLERGRDVR